MRIVQGCVLLALLAGLALVPRVTLAQTGGPSDSLSETVVDLGTGLSIPLVAPPNVFAPIPEGTGETLSFFVPMPPRQIDFMEGTGPNQHLSDRLTISPYEVQVQSDSNPNGLPPRTLPNVIRIPASALEKFQPIRIEAFSDGELTNTTASDTLTITLGWFGPGTGSVSTFTIPPVPEGQTEPPLTVFIPPTLFDIEEPPVEVGGAQGIISDYVDILNQIQVTFISSDDLPFTPPPNGVVFESLETGGGVRYSLDFFSDAVPEPATFALLSMGLLSLGLIGRRRQLR